MPRWKYSITYLQEVLAIKVIGMTKGGMPHFESIDAFRAAIEKAGADVFRAEDLHAVRHLDEGEFTIPQGLEGCVPEGTFLCRLFR